MITGEWKKFRGWLVLEFFLNHDKPIYVKELSRQLKISPYTANYYLKFYKNSGVLEEEKEGNLLLYSLKDTFLANRLKSFYVLDRLFDFTKKFCKINNITSLVLYGSHATGDYDEKSDVDLLVVSQVKKLDLKEVEKLEKEINKEVKIQVFSLGEWRALKKKKNSFVRSLLMNYILLWGPEI